MRLQTPSLCLLHRWETREERCGWMQRHNSIATAARERWPKQQVEMSFAARGGAWREEVGETLTGDGCHNR